MNSKERVTAAIARAPVDRVPLGFYAVDHDTVARVLGHPTYVRNKIEIQVALWEGRRDEVAKGLKEDTVAFYRKIDCADILLPKEAQLLPPADYDPDPPKRIAELRWEDRTGRIYQAVPQTNEIQCVYDPQQGQTTYSVDDFRDPLEVTPPDPSIFEVLDYVVEQLGEDRYVAGTTGGITALTFLDGMQNGLMLYASQPEVIVAANRQSVAAQNMRDKYFIRPDVPGVLMEQDMAGTTGPWVSPQMFKELCFPFLRERIAHVKKSVPQVIFHNCGNNIPLMEMFIEAGIDCYQSLQTTAGMEVWKLKQMFGDRLSFWGGVPVEALIVGTPEDVRNAVRTAMERGAPGGGFILGPSHSVAMNTTYDNFMAMLDEFVRLRDSF
ncbi:MAG: uroporphyrinogen decarboxylase family protein [Kiritimatiellae bacterium]|nr:uroporphyrinogen decarboxylase family protein [Kiritimatiellia bacterium]